MDRGGRESPHYSVEAAETQVRHRGHQGRYPSYQGQPRLNLYFVMVMPVTWNMIHVDILISHQQMELYLIVKVIILILFLIAVIVNSA